MNSNFYYITEIYPSIQGEGPRAGFRSLFIRFHYCHLTCSWCDSKYTWHKKSAPFKTYTKDQLILIIKKYNIKNIVLTGGEPTLYRLDLLYVKDFNFQIETSGSLFPIKSLDISLPDKTVFKRKKMKSNIVKKFQWIISPKLSNSNQKLNHQVLHYFSKLKNVFFKFVVTNVDKDLEEINLLKKKHHLNDDKIFVSLEGNQRKTQINPKSVNKIIEKYHYSPRLQVLLWPGKVK